MKSFNLFFKKDFFWLCLLSVLVTIFADYITYTDHYVYPAKPEYLEIPKYSKSDVPNWSPGKGHSFIDLSRISLEVDCAKSSVVDCKSSGSTFELLMFKLSSTESWSDYWPNGVYCCTADDVQDDACSDDDLGELIIPNNLPSYYLQQFKVTSSQPKLLGIESDVFHHEISDSGEYVFLMAVCNEHSGPVKINGVIESLDPYGLLPANLFGFMPFYGALSILYTLLGILWMINCTIYQDQLISIHFWISGVLALGMIETTALFFNYLHWNDKGTQSMAINVISLIFGVFKRSLSRIVVQFIALGYGIVRPTIGEDYGRVLFLGAVYCLLSLLYSLVTSLPKFNKTIESQSEMDFLSMVVLALAAIDTTFYIWILTSISNLLISLAARKQGIKYLLYRNFRNVLILSVFFTIVWGLYRSVVLYGDNISTWQLEWTVDSLWELMYFLVFAAIAYLWAPSLNSLRYAYSVELTQLDDDEEYKNPNNEAELDSEYGGKLQDDTDPFLGGGALDPSAAFAKKA